MLANVRRILRLVTILTAALFLISCILNFGAKIPLGFIQLSFSIPIASIGTDEIVIGLVLLAAAVVSRLYVYGGAYILASVGIAEGLLNPNVQGFARNLHETMVPLTIIGWVMLALETQSRYNSRVDKSPSKRTREIITALQFFVGGLVTLGGASYASFATYPVGTALGVIHLAVGLAGLFAGYAFLRRKAWSRRLLIAINSVTIVYSGFSESLAEIYALLPRGINDALIGTIIAMIVSGVIIYLLRLKSESSQ